MVYWGDQTQDHSATAAPESLNSCYITPSVASLQKMIGCFNHWVVTMAADKLRRRGFERFTLVLEANCISNLNPNHPYNWQPPNICDYNYTSDVYVVTLSQMFSGYYICCWMLCNTSMQVDVQWLLYISARSWLQDSLGSFLYVCLMQLANYVLHNHCLFSCLQPG